MAVFLGVSGIFALVVPRLWAVRPDVTPGFEPLDLLGLALALLQTVPIASRRSRPLSVLVIIGGATVASGGFGFDSAIGGAAALVALYSVAVHTDRRTSLTALAVTAVSLAATIILSTSFDLGLDTFVGNLLLYGSIWLIGDNRRVTRAYTRELEARAERLERDREAEAARAVADERGRIARELHDVVTHSVTVMTVQASAARRVLRTSPGDAEAALASIESTGRDALAEMRRLLGVLRTDEGGPDLRPQPGLDRMGELVAQMQATGLPVEVSVEGEARPLPSGVDLAAFRIVQEALTNSLKHAGKARATVRIRYGPDTLDLRVADDGRGAAAALIQGSGGSGGSSGSGASGRGAGHGLIGMRERVSLYGGAFEAGPRPEGGYAVHAQIPLDPTVA